MRHRRLSDVVGVAVISHVSRGMSEDPRVLAWWEPSQVGNSDLDQEIAVGLEITSGVGEASDLLILSEEIPDRVVNEVHQPEAAFYTVSAGRLGQVARTRVGSHRHKTADRARPNPSPNIGLDRP